MQIDLKVDTSQLEVKLYLLSEAAAVAPGVVFKEEVKAIIKNIWQLTPPKTFAQGRKAVAGDLNRVVYPLEYSEIDWEPLKRAVQNNNDDLVRKLLLRKKTVQNLVLDTGSIATEHKRLRNRRGRVGKGIKPMIAAYAKIANKYLNQIQTRVGWAKSGWVSAYNSTGAAAPNWLQRLSAQAGYSVTNYGKNPSVSATAVNNKIPNYQRVVDNAVANRVRVTQRKIDMVVQGKAVNLGFTVIDAKN